MKDALDGFVLFAARTHCCRRNASSMLARTRNRENVSAAGCAARCAASAPACHFFSHADTWKACFLCASCDTGVQAQAPRMVTGHYTSWCAATAAGTCDLAPHNGTRLTLPLRLLPSRLDNPPLAATCPVSILMVEDRELRPDAYWTKAAAINAAAARRWGWSFAIVRPTSGPWRKWAKNWCKLPALEAELARATGTASPCSWVLVIDSDAFVRAYPCFIRQACYFLLWGLA